MNRPLFTAANGFDRAAIMLKAWADARSNKFFARLTLAQRRRAFGDALKKAWRMARNIRARAAQDARDPIRAASALRGDRIDCLAKALAPATAEAA